MLNNGTNYNYGPDEQGEYLCIVSKDVGESQNTSTEEMYPTSLNTKVWHYCYFGQCSLKGYNEPKFLICSVSFKIII